MSYIFVPKDVTPGKYTGGLEQPIDWQRNRKLCVVHNENCIVVIVKGKSLAPQDRDAFILFETRYSTGNSTLVYDGISLRLDVQETNLPMDSLTDQDLFTLVVECYEVINIQKTDYTDLMSKQYFDQAFTIEKRVGDVPSNETILGAEYERAPDVFVRPQSNN